MNYYNYGFVNVSCVTPKLKLADPLENAKNIIRLSKILSEKENMICLFPELSLTGYSCEDLFLNSELLNKTILGLKYCLDESKNINSVIIVGHPFQYKNGELYNVASVIYKGKLLGIVPKTYLPNYGEFYEKRWFSSGKNINSKINVLGQDTIFSAKTIFNINQNVFLGIEICEDLWAPNPPSTYLALNGANIICNLSASNELISKKNYRRDLISQQSARLNCAYLYASSGIYESSKDVVFGGHNLIFENGSSLNEGSLFELDDVYIEGNIDIDKLSNERRKNKTFDLGYHEDSFNEVNVKFDYTLSKLTRKYNKNPFLPKDNLKDRMDEILDIQVAGLTRKLLSMKKPKIVLGLSGGLDSTLALIVAKKAIKKLKLNSNAIVTISMPGFGTSSRTKKQSNGLASIFKTDHREISIVKASKQHFKDIGHKEDDFSVVYENTQARERTQILFDIANIEGAIVLGTGDLSEIALGWSTFNGDHMSSYNVNASIPKTLVQYIVKNFADNSENSLKKVLYNILGTDISPELLPKKMKQTTESSIGPYEYHDFFLFHFIRNGFNFDKIKMIAELTFEDPKIIYWLNIFKKRFYGNQFKRTASPAGVKVGSVSLSPRGDWRMPDEVEIE